MPGCGGCTTGNSYNPGGHYVGVRINENEDGRVVFCNRDWQLDLADPGGFLGMYEKTKSANAFNWMLQNVGAGTHSIVVKGQLAVFVTGVGTAQAGVGRRTLIAEPAHLTNDATF